MKTNKYLKRLLVLFIFLIGVFALSACTVPPITTAVIELNIVPAGAEVDVISSDGGTFTKSGDKYTLNVKLIKNISISIVSKETASVKYAPATIHVNANDMSEGSFSRTVTLTPKDDNVICEITVLTANATVEGLNAEWTKTSNVFKAKVKASEITANSKITVKAEGFTSREITVDPSNIASGFLFETLKLVRTGKSLLIIEEDRQNSGISEIEISNIDNGKSYTISYSESMRFCEVDGGALLQISYRTGYWEMRAIKYTANETYPDAIVLDTTSNTSPQPSEPPELPQEVEYDVSFLVPHDKNWRPEYVVYYVFEDRVQYVYPVLYDMLPQDDLGTGYNDKLYQIRLFAPQGLDLYFTFYDEQNYQYYYVGLLETEGKTSFTESDFKFLDANLEFTSNDLFTSQYLYVNLKVYDKLAKDYMTFKIDEDIEDNVFLSASSDTQRISNARQFETLFNTSGTELSQNYVVVNSFSGNLLFTWLEYADENNTVVVNVVENFKLTVTLNDGTEVECDSKSADNYYSLYTQNIYDEYMIVTCYLNDEITDKNGMARSQDFLIWNEFIVNGEYTKPLLFTKAYSIRFNCIINGYFDTTNGYGSYFFESNEFVDTREGAGLNYDEHTNSYTVTLRIYVGAEGKIMLYNLDRNFEGSFVFDEEALAEYLSSSESTLTITFTEIISESQGGKR